MFIPRDIANIIKSYSDDLSLRLVSTAWSDQYDGYLEMINTLDPETAHKIASKVIGERRAYLWIFKRFDVPSSIIYAAKTNYFDVDNCKFLLKTFSMVAVTEPPSRKNYFYHKLYDRVTDRQTESCIYVRDVGFKEIIFALSIPIFIITATVISIVIYMLTPNKDKSIPIVLGLCSIVAVASFHVLFIGINFVYKMTRDTEQQAYDFENYPKPKLIKL